MVGTNLVPIGTNFAEGHQRLKLYPNRPPSARDTLDRALRALFATRDSREVYTKQGYRNRDVRNGLPKLVPERLTFLF